MRSHTDIDNILFDRLSRQLPGLLASQKRMHVPSRTVLYNAGSTMPHLYFPAGGVISAVVREREGECAEVASIGVEGVAPLFALLGLHRCPLLLIQQVPGELIQVPAAPVVRALREHQAIQSLFHSYFAYSMRASQQNTVCNALHSALARTARALLTTADRARRDQFYLTQDMLAEMLGTPRQTVNVSIRELAKRQLLRSNRGNVQLLDREALMRASCRCYSVLAAHHWEGMI